MSTAVAVLERVDQALATIFRRRERRAADRAKDLSQFVGSVVKKETISDHEIETASELYGLSPEQVREAIARGVRRLERRAVIDGEAKHRADLAKVRTDREKQTAKFERQRKENGEVLDGATRRERVAVTAIKQIEAAKRDLQNTADPALKAKRDRIVERRRDEMAKRDRLIAHLGSWHNLTRRHEDDIRRIERQQEAWSNGSPSLRRLGTRPNVAVLESAKLKAANTERRAAEVQTRVDELDKRIAAIGQEITTIESKMLEV